jgi:hypothetical protein
VIFVLFNSTIFSQDKGTSNIKAGIGVFSSSSLLDITSNLVFSSLSAGTVKYDNISGFGALYLTYEYAIANGLMLGATFVYESVTEDIFIGENPSGEVSHNHFTTGLEANYHYISGELFQMYSGVGVGYTTQSDKYDGSESNVEDGSDSYFNFQINALGFRYGSNFGIFAEVGFGYKGLLNAGLSYQF